MRADDWDKVIVVVCFVVAIALLFLNNIGWGN